MSDAREQLKRFLHYSGRYLAHKQSKGLESKLKAKIETKAAQLRNMSYSNAEFLFDAYNALQKCRSTLTYTFAFAYYLKDTNEKLIFEAVS